MKSGLLIGKGIPRAPLFQGSFLQTIFLILTLAWWEIVFQADYFSEIELRELVVSAMGADQLNLGHVGENSVGFAVSLPENVRF